MKELKITRCNINEALSQLDMIAGLGFKQRGCLRLLTEEMFSMCQELLDVSSLDFGIKQNSTQYTLSGSTKTRVDETARKQLLSASSSGENAANKGIHGILGDVLELFSIDGDSEFYNAALPYGMNAPTDVDLCMYTLSLYMQESLEADQHQWDGLEKSIIANFADDVSIAVRNHKLEMIITKKF